MKAKQRERAWKKHSHLGLPTKQAILTPLTSSDPQNFLPAQPRCTAVQSYPKEKSTLIYMSFQITENKKGLHRMEKKVTSQVNYEIPFPKQFISSINPNTSAYNFIQQ